MKGRSHQFPQAGASEEEETLDLVHTPMQPYCADPTCWCHSDVAYHEDVTHPPVTDTDILHAYAFLGIATCEGGQS